MIWSTVEVQSWSAAWNCITWPTGTPTYTLASGRLTDSKGGIRNRLELNEAARAGIEALNRTYSTPGGSTFNLFRAAEPE